MSERPILMSAPMVRAILDGTKRQTRRIIATEWNHGFKGSESCPYVKRPLRRESGAADFVTYSDLYTQEFGEPVWFYSWGNARWLRCPYGAPGDRLWVRETWCQAVDPITSKLIEGKAHYRADGHEVFLDDGDGGHAINRDGTFASPWRPSIFMPRWASRITLAVESVRVERLQDISEKDAKAEGVGAPFPLSHRAAFASLWREINGAESWAANPWVWVLGFSRVEVTRG